MYTPSRWPYMAVTTGFDMVLSLYTECGIIHLETTMNYITIERAANQCGISHSAMGIAVKRRGMNTMLSRGKKNNKLILVSKDDVDNFAKLRSTYGHVPHGFITVFSAANLFGCGDSTIKTLVKRHLVNSVISLNHRGVETLFVDREGIKNAIKDAKTS